MVEEDGRTKKRIEEDRRTMQSDEMYCSEGELASKEAGIEEVGSKRVQVDESTRRCDAYALSPLILRANCISFGMMVTLFA